MGSGVSEAVPEGTLSVAARASLSERTLLLLRAFAPQTGLSVDEIAFTGVSGYVRFMHATHAYMRASVPLMVAARDRFQLLGEKDVVSYLNQHIIEETGHDTWLLEDLATHDLETDTTEIALLPEFATACGCQYYHILHGNPWLFFAYVFALEISPPTTHLIAELEKRTGLNPTAFRTLQEHQDLDDGHAADLAELIDTFDLSPSVDLAFQQNALLSRTQIHVGIRRALKQDA